MNRNAILTHSRAWFKRGIGIALFLLATVGANSPQMAHGVQLLSTIGPKGWTLADIVHLYKRAWNSLGEKARTIRDVHQDNARLRSENTELKFELAHLQSGCRGEEAKAATESKESVLSKETGATTGRTLASISYKPPEDLLPAQLYTLGVSYFEAQEDEKAAVIFTTLANLEETSAYRTAKHLMLTGIAWFRVENYSLADAYFNEVLKKSEDENSIQYQARTRLWKAIVAKKLNKNIKSQYWLRELVDHHPHAPETQWINSEVAIEKVKHEKHQKH